MTAIAETPAEVDALHERFVDVLDQRARWAFGKWG